MKIALTGATGFVGNEALEVCRALGHEPVPLTRTTSGLPQEIVTGPLEGLPPSDGLKGVGAVLHLAARTHVVRAREGDVDRYFRVNVIGTRRLLEVAVRSGVRRFVFMSSVKAVAERSGRNSPVTVDTVPNPEDAYGRSKRQAEEEVRARCEAEGMEWVIIRPPLVRGAEASGNLARIAALLGKGVPLPLGSICNRRTFVWVETLARAAVLACVADKAANSILLPCDATLSTPELIRQLAAAEGKRARLFPFPVPLLQLAGRVLGRGDDVERLCGSLEIDPGPTFEVLGWRPDGTGPASEARRT